MKPEQIPAPAGSEQRNRWFFDRMGSACIVSVLLLFAGEVLTLPMLVTGQRIRGSMPELSFLLTAYLHFIGIWAVFLLVMLVFGKERPLFAKLSFRRSGRAVLLGIAAGLGMNLLSALIAMLSGDLAVRFNGASLLWMLAALPAVLIQSAAEELMTRLFLFQKLRRAYRSPLPAILCSGLLFSLLHVFNPGVTVLALVNITLIGFFYALVIYYFDAFWFAAFHHTMWNYTQNFLIGLPNSGLNPAFSLFSIRSAVPDVSFFYDPFFGVEGTLLTSLILLAGVAAVIWLGQKKRRAEGEAAA